MRTPDDQVLGILHELDRTLQLRLAVHDQIPKAMLKYEIKDGKVTFKVKNTFEAVMTVAGAANDDRWYLLAVSFGVDCESSMFPSEYFSPIKFTTLASRQRISTTRSINT